MTVVELISVEAELHAQEDKVEDLWGAHPSMRQFLQDHYPRVWEDVCLCRSSWVVKEHVDASGEYRVAPRRSCHRLPFCLVCVRGEEWRRAWQFVEALHLCTPKGEKPAAVHVVQTAPLTEEGEGWGAKARLNHAAFGRLVAGALEHVYRGPVGAVLAYQDFGERPFVKPHPHVDGLVNGWVLRDGRPAKLPRLDLGSSEEHGPDLVRWHDDVVARAQSFQLGARQGSFSLSERLDHEGALLKVGRYALREMVNLRQLEYDRAGQTVEWMDYKTKESTVLKVREWKAGLAEYMWRLGQWREGQGKRAKHLHAYHGDLAKARRARTQKAMGGKAREHDRLCPCPKCANWSEVPWSVVQERLKAMGRPGV